jgi:hypothetical protein
VIYNRTASMPKPGETDIQMTLSRIMRILPVKLKDSLDVFDDAAMDAFMERVSKLN